MENSMEEIKKLKRELPYDAVYSWAYIPPKLRLIQKATCIPVFIATLYSMAKTWNVQPKCSSTVEGINKMWCIYTIEYYSTIKKNEVIPSSATWMNLEIIILSEVSQRKTNAMWYHIYVESKIWHKWTYLWNRNRSTDIENSLVVTLVRGKDWEFGTSRCKLLRIEWINNKILQYTTGKYIQYPVINHIRIWKRTHMHIYMDHCAIHLKLTQCYKSTTIKNGNLKYYWWVCTPSKVLVIFI